MNDSHNLDQPADWAGIWWLSDNPDEKVPGVLHYDGKGALALSLIGNFENPVIKEEPFLGGTKIKLVDGETRTWNVVHGVAENQEITLLGCDYKNTKHTLIAPVWSPDKQTIEASIALIGIHIKNENIPVFPSVEVSFEDLGVWAAISGIERGFGFSDSEELDGRGCIQVTPCSEQSVTVENKEICLIPRNTFPYLEDQKGRKIARISESVRIQIKSKTPLSLTDTLEEMVTIQNLISLAMHRAVGTIWVQLEIDGTESRLPDGRELPRRRAQMLYKPPALGVADAQAVETHRTLFTCDTIPFSEIVPRWYEVHSQMQTAINMIMSLRYAPTQYIESNLLTSVGAAEVIHRRLKIGTRPFPTDTFTDMRSAMLAQVPEEHRDRFRSAIRNDQTLRDRLHDLVNYLEPTIISRLMPDAEEWAKRAVRARNNLAHEGKTNHSDEELITIVDVTTIVVIFIILQELGVSVEQQLNIFDENLQIGGIARRAHKIIVAPAKES